MKTKYLIVSLFISAIFLTPFTSLQAQTPTIKSLLEQLQSLFQQVQELQKKIAQTRTQIRETLRTDLRQGMSDEDIRKIQEILATDPGIYPEGFVTGYFGPLTREALRRFQARFDLRVSGEIDEETRLHLEELLRERFGDRIPPGLLRAPGIQKKVELRLKEGCDNAGRGTVPFCQKIRIKVDKDKDNNSDNDSSELEIEVEIEDGKAKVEIEYGNGTEEKFTFNLTNHEEIIDEIVSRTDLTKDEVKDVITFKDGNSSDDDSDDSNDDDSDDN